MEYMTVRDAARHWGVTERLVQRLCADGRINGAEKFAGSWRIPEGAPKPVDPRRTPAPSRPKRTSSPPTRSGSRAAPSSAIAPPFAASAASVPHFSEIEHVFFYSSGRSATI